MVRFLVYIDHYDIFTCISYRPLTNLLDMPKKSGHDQIETNDVLQFFRKTFTKHKYYIINNQIFILIF